MSQIENVESSAQQSDISRQNLVERFDILLALLTVYIIWGSTYLAIRFAVVSFPPLLMGGIRFTVVGVALYLFLRARGVPNPTWRQWLGSSIVGGLLLLCGNGGVAYSETMVASGLAAMMVGTIPLWAALIAGLWGLWPGRWEVVGLIVGFAGLVLLNLGSDLRTHPTGAIVLLLAAMCWALGSVWSRHLSLPSGLMASAAEMTVGGGLMFVAGFGTGEHLTTTPTAKSVWALLYLMVLGSLVAFSAYAYLLQRARPALATSYAYVNPVVAVALGAVFAGERVGTTGLVALVLTLTGVALVVMSRSSIRGSVREEV
jgi:drug/metabolite transporter (DMT)-like permease